MRDDEQHSANLSLRAQNIVKTFKTRRVVDDVSFSVETGKVVGLLGPNGAGKTTSFYMIVGLLFPATGGYFSEIRKLLTYPCISEPKKGFPTSLRICPFLGVLALPIISLPSCRS